MRTNDEACVNYCEISKASVLENNGTNYRKVDVGCGELSGRGSERYRLDARTISTYSQLSAESTSSVQALIFVAAAGSHST